MDNLFTMTDDQLVTSYVAGNKNAFDVILSRHQQSLYGYILYSVRDREVANDIFQDTFVKAINTIQQGRYTETGKFKAWLNRIAHNLVIDYFRVEKEKNSMCNREYDGDVFNQASLSEDTIETVMVNNQVMADVRKLVEYLPDTQREVLQMRYYQGLSFKEIADATGVSINTALGRMRYAILTLRKLAADNQMTLSLN